MADLIIIGNPSNAPNTANEAFPIALTGNSLNDTLTALRNQRLAVIQGGPKPTYYVQGTGRAVLWNEYLAWLDSAIMQVMQEIAQVDAFEIVSQGI